MIKQPDDMINRLKTYKNGVKMIEIFFHNLPSFTLVQFLQTWGLLSVAGFILRYV